MAKINVKPEYKELVKLFDSLTGARNLWQIFNECIEMFAISIQNMFTIGKKYNDNEERYKQIASHYTKDEINVVIGIFSKIMSMAEENPFRDLLGDLYMQLNMGSDALGQFFTPYSVSRLMAQCSLNIDIAKSEIEKKGYITLNEPCVGGGANIIAACEWLYINDINFQSQCVIVGQDLSRLTALMCYVVFSLIGCSAVIKIGDTLSNPYTDYQHEIAKGSEIWTTPMFHIHNCYSKI